MINRSQRRRETIAIILIPGHELQDSQRREKPGLLLMVNQLTSPVEMQLNGRIQINGEHESRIEINFTVNGSL